MTDQKILELADELFEEWEAEEDGKIWYECYEERLLKFTHQIRKQTLEEVIFVLQNVPNPEANRAAINRIETELNR